MNYKDLPKAIANHYKEKDVRSAKITSKRGEQLFIVYLMNGIEHKWGWSNRLGWYKITHRPGPHVDLVSASSSC